MPNYDDPLYQAAINAVRTAYQQALKTKLCKNCGYLAEDWAAGTGKYFCSHPETDFVELEFNLVDNPANDCDFFERK
ncbi:MAG: hypothetical protein V7L31_06320 [Nostoc sp.]|uniref:hypothetical protein n=1 Tax=Nostoc sp. TaxID=1180 RepID=UPI002FEF63D3